MSDQITIQFLNGPRADEKIRLLQLPVFFGRTNDSAIVLEWDGMVSGRHFEVFCDEGAFFLRDAGSRNGTKINDMPVLRQRLYAGDLIEVGGSRLKVFIEVSAAPTSPPPDKSADSVVDRQSPSTARVDMRSRINPFDSGFTDDLASSDSTSLSSIIQVQDGTRLPSPNHPLVQDSVPSAQPLPVENSTAQAERNMAGPAPIEQVRLRMLDASQSSFGSASVNRIFWLSAGQEMTIGRSPKCDCAIESDSYLSSAHFRVVCESSHCHIEDLGSKAGTSLNGVPVQKARVFHGDRVLAGRTEFEIEMDGPTGPVVRSASDRTAKPVESPVEVPGLVGQSLALAREKCPSGIYVLDGISIDQLPLPVMVDLVRPLGPVFLLIDVSRGSMALPDDLDLTTGQLFHWLPPQLAGSSPQLFALEDLPDWPNRVSDVLGSDGLVILQSDKGKAEVLAGLTKCLGGNPAGKKAFQGILGICWPSVMTATLQSQANEFASQLFTDVSLVIAETKNGKACQVFASDPGRLDAILGLLDRRRIGYSINRADPTGETPKVP